jgi:dihydrodipicolinate synthase/N-acetylneuraminate lyase
MPLSKRRREMDREPCRGARRTDGDPLASVSPGVTVALVTPFVAKRRGGLGRLGKLVDWHAEQGTDALAPCGTTGESPTLTHDENERVVAFVCERPGAG